jgi:hypothetical protein
MPSYTYTNTTYIETAAGDRFLETVKAVSDGSKVRSSSFYHDGRAATVLYDTNNSRVQTQVSITRVFQREDKPGTNARPVPLSLFYVDKTPLREALPNAEYLGEETGTLGLCDKYLFKNVPARSSLQDQIYYLDHATALPVRVDVLVASGARKGQTVLSWAATKVETIQGHPFATESVTTNYRNKDVVSTVSHEVLSVRYDSDLSSVAFWPTIDPGVPVADAIAKTMTVTPGRPKVHPVKTTLPLSTTTTPIVAEPPRDWSSVLSYGGMALGAAVLVAAFLIWRRR